MNRLKVRVALFTFTLIFPGSESDPMRSSNRKQEEKHLERHEIKWSEKVLLLEAEAF